MKSQRTSRIFWDGRDRISTKNILSSGLVISLLLTVAQAIVKFSNLPSYFIPVATGPILIVILTNNPQLAFLVNVILSVLTGMLVGNRLDLTTIFLIGGTVGIRFAWQARRRSNLVKAGFLTGLAQLFSIIPIEIFKGSSFLISIKEGFWGMGNGLSCAFLSLGTMPIFEYLFRFITNISLLELADLNQPLLKKMVLNAPGTYHHSLIVGNLAESACEAIGANSLLARVGSYYHDIGKIENADYFSENQTGRKSRHDKLTPSMSHLIIMNHIKDGVELAQKYKLNKAIVDFIEQHHGTSLVFYFYQRALEKLTLEDKVDEESFRYPGPKPQTKETAVVLLADSVEAASRVLDEPTPARINGLVHKIINNKFIDGQLNDCDLTLKDIHKIAATFSHILTGMFHNRIEYPSPDADRAPKLTEEDSSESKEDKEGDRENP